MTGPRVPFPSLLTGPNGPLNSNIDRKLLTQQPDATATQSQGAPPPWPRESIAHRIPYVWTSAPLGNHSYESADVNSYADAPGTPHENRFVKAAKAFKFPTDPIGRTLVVAKFANDVGLDPMEDPDAKTTFWDNIRSRAFVPYNQIPSDVIQKITQRLHESRKMMSASLVEKLAASMALNDWDRVDSLVAGAENERNQP